MKRLAIALCLLALPAAALADGDYRWELTPHLSYAFGGTLETSTAVPFSGDVTLSNEPAIGVMFDIPLTDNLQVELLLNHHENSLKFRNSLFERSSTFTDMDVTYAHIGLLAQFGRREVTPYFVVSGGLTRLDPSLPGVGASDRFSLSLGGGVKLFVLPFLGIRLEARGFWTDVDKLRGPCSGTCVDYRDYLSQGEATVGVIFAW
jgi:hypothetical protein